MTDIASSAFSSRSHIVAYWVTTALLVSELALGGVWDILRVPQVRVLIERLGNPLYFLVILGIGTLHGAVALVIPRFPRLKPNARRTTYPRSLLSENAHPVKR